MEEIDENKQIPHIFNKRLDESTSTSKLKGLSIYSGISIWDDKEEIEEILSKLLRNIGLIISEYSGNPKKRCRGVNHWFNEKIKTYDDRNRKSFSDYAMAVLNEVKWNTGNNNIVCKRDETPYPTNHVDLMKKLDDYCEIRDNIRCSVLKNETECLKYNSYIRENKEYFSSQINNICSTDCSREKYKIDAKCTLNNMDLTFPDINCDGLYKKEELKKPEPIIKERSPLEIGFFIIVSFILFYLFILFLEKFTPVGSIISRFRRRKYALKRNIERVDDYRYSLYHSETMPSDSENKRYYIEYGRRKN
ncbi:VIR protein [Plasmodium vivax]|uniref:VIR protein n=1 Tax=Plasmodium vivax TaxID=5855 RepID=A0A1G4HIC1_PLAVI|nr:VIR protein [Plasmodium vivax]